MYPPQQLFDGKETTSEPMSSLSLPLPLFLLFLLFLFSIFLLLLGLLSALVALREEKRKTVKKSDKSGWASIVFSSCSDIKSDSWIH
jgi:hypothetical protein